MLQGFRPSSQIVGGDDEVKDDEIKVCVEYTVYMYVQLYLSKFQFQVKVSQGNTEETQQGRGEQGGRLGEGGGWKGKGKVSGL